MKPGDGPLRIRLAVGFAKLAIGLLPHGFQSQVKGDLAAGVLERSQGFWGLQHYSHERESGPPKKEPCPPVTRVGLEETRVVRDAFPRILCTSAGAVTGSGDQVAQVIVMGGHD